MPSPGAATSPIPRHPVDVAWCRERTAALKSKLAMYEEAIAKDVRHTNAARIAAEQYGGYAQVAAPAPAETCRALRLGARAMGVLFDGATAQAPQPASDLQDAGNWLGGFFLAAICRDAALLERLAAVPVDVLRSSTTRADEYAYLYIEALQAYVRRQRNAPALLLAALKATDPQRLQPASVDYVLNVVVPQMELLFRIMDRDAAGVNAALAKALQSHRDYWANGERAADPRGYVSFPLLGLAGFAHDDGLPIEVSSEYLPRPLVEGACRS